jgi:hypothetical protein
MPFTIPRTAKENKIARRRYMEGGWETPHQPGSPYNLFSTN